MSILVIAEHDNASLKGTTLNTLTLRLLSEERFICWWLEVTVALL